MTVPTSGGVSQGQNKSGSAAPSTVLRPDTFDKLYGCGIICRLIINNELLLCEPAFAFLSVIDWEIKLGEKAL